MSNARFRPTRAGIINLWDYRDQEFSFADGRLVLRGPNGSGKTKALEVLFPFVFDGRIEPRRLNPFAGEERTMKSNLLYRGQDSAHSYVWMEFCRGSLEDPESVTVGIGMRATRTNDKVTRWYFVADGRVGVDFSLIGNDDRPLTKKQLAEQLGSDSITDRPLDYRTAIDARMFGLGVQRYDQLINLILTLRRPQLAKNLDPKGLSQALTDGLRPLDDQLVLEAARSFSDMEEVGRALEGLAAADQAAQSFIGVYTKYLRQQSRGEIEQVSTRLAAVTRGVAAMDESSLAQTRSREARAAAEERFNQAEQALENARANVEALQRSSAYEGKQQLDDLAQAVSTLKLSTEQQADKSRKAQAALAQRGDEATRLHRRSSVQPRHSHVPRTNCRQPPRTPASSGLPCPTAHAATRSPQQCVAMPRSVTATYASSALRSRPSRRPLPNEPGPKTARAVDKSCSKRPRPLCSRAKLPWNSHAVSAPVGCARGGPITPPCFRLSAPTPRCSRLSTRRSPRSATRTLRRCPQFSPSTPRQAPRRCASDVVRPKLKYLHHTPPSQL